MRAQTTCETVSSPVETFADLSHDIDALAVLQERAKEIEERARQLRASIKEGMARTGIDAFVSGNGHRATMCQQVTSHIDRTLVPENILAMALKTSTMIVLRVK